jgi:hypothetical protein
MCSAIGHCLLPEGGNELILVDAGIGLSETKHPEERLGKVLIESTWFRFSEKASVKGKWKTRFPL